MFSKNICTLLTATSLISSGVLLLILRIWIFDSIIAAIYKLGPNSPLLDIWRTPPLEINADFYFFNWTNPEDIPNATIKPKFQEIGPYRFRYYVEKVNITWHANSTATFKMFQEYYFDEENSIGKLTDQITTLNTVVVSTVHKLRNAGYFKKKGFSLSLAALAPQIDVTRSAGELLFEGYQDPYIDLVETIPFLSEFQTPFDKAGFLYGRNSSYEREGIFNVATGEDQNPGEILTWNHHNESLEYNGSCKKLGGSIGDFFRAKQTRNKINFFMAYACRNLVLDYEEDVVVSNIDGYKYSAGHSTLDNGTFSSENKCLCNGECIPSGLMNISSCFVAPSFLSLPHFYNADPVYLNKVEGLRPEKSKHELYVTLEPRIGVCIDMALRFQMNFLLQPVEDITLYEDVPKIFFPLVWFEQKVSIPSKIAWIFRILLNLPNTIIPVLAVILIIVGCALFAFEIRRSKQQKKLMKFKISKNEAVNGEGICLQAKKNYSKHSTKPNCELI